jgi:uncharacterized protein YecT (DUF1311 family)
MARGWAGLCLGVALALSGPVAAQDVPFDAAPIHACLDRGESLSCVGAGVDACVQKLGVATVTIAACLDAERAFWDNVLNTTYRELIAREDAADAEFARDPGFAGRPSGAAALRAAQRAWITLRDTTCAYEELQWWGGTGASGVHVGCNLRLTGDRALWMRDMLGGM